MFRRFVKIINPRAALLHIALGLALFAGIFLWVVHSGDRLSMLRLLGLIFAVLVPLALVCMAIVAVPYYFIPWMIYAFRLIRHRRLRREGRCTYCGYSLTGNQSGVCPECGWKTQ